MFRITVKYYKKSICDVTNPAYGKTLITSAVTPFQSALNPSFLIIFYTSLKQFIHVNYFPGVAFFNYTYMEKDCIITWNIILIRDTGAKNNLLIIPEVPPVLQII